MKLIKHNNKYKIVDKLNRVAVTYNPINKLDDIFLNGNGWKTSTKEVIEDYECETIIEDSCWPINKFKDLKHRVAAYLIMNNIESNIPAAYKNAFKQNGNMYNKIKKDGSFK